MNTYSLEKWVWTDADLEKMGWHDASIYAMRLEGDLSFDIDYIFKWNEPEVPGFHFTFFVAPCTLIFNSIRDLSFELSQQMKGKPIEVEDVECEFREGSQYYTILTREGYISFSASGFKQIVRMHPSFQLEQTLAYDERGGTGFETKTDMRLDPNVQERVNERRRKEYEHYTWAKERHLLMADIEKLQHRREANEISLTDFIKESKYLNDKRTYYDMILRGTNYQD